MGYRFQRWNKSQYTGCKWTLGSCMVSLQSFFIAKVWLLSSRSNAIPLAIFAYLGIEMMTVTAFEARSTTREAMWPARNIAWITTAIYILTTLTFVLNVSWRNPLLPQFYDQGISGTTAIKGAPERCIATVSKNTTQSTQQNSWPAPVIAVDRAGLHGGVLVACFMYSALSSANTGSTSHLELFTVLRVTSRLYVRLQCGYGFLLQYPPWSRRQNRHGGRSWFLCCFCRAGYLLYISGAAIQC